MTKPYAYSLPTLRCDACGVAGPGHGLGRFRFVEDLDKAPWEDVMCRPVLCNKCVKAVLRMLTQGLVEQGKEER